MTISTYLHWLSREDAKSLVNVFVKKSDGVRGDTFPTADAIPYIGSHRTYDAIWATVHSVKPSGVGKSKLTKTDIDAYRYLAIDIDCRVAHERKLSATDDERARTRATADKMIAMLMAHGMPQPLQAMSGNGSLLLFPIDLPYTESNYNLLARFAEVLSSIFSDEHCEVDEAVMKDPCRILGVIGTMNRSKAELSSEGRCAKERTIVGEYPQNEPMTADAFIEVATAIIAEHEGLSVDASAVGPMPVAERPIRPIGSDGHKPSGWDGVDGIGGRDAVGRCKAYLSKCSDAIEGQHGHDATLRAACECYRFGLSDEQAKQIMDWFNDTKCQPSWADAEINHKLRDASKLVIAKGEIGIRLQDGVRDEDRNEQRDGVDGVDGEQVRAPEKNAEYPQTDVGNAEHFATVYGENLQYVDQWDAWLIWDGKRWTRDNTSKVRRMGIRMVRHTMLDHAKSMKDEDRRAKYLKWASMSQSQGRIEAMLSLASSLLACSAEDLDRNGNLLNLANGTMELDTLAFRAHDRRDLLTKMSETIYDASATAPQWERFIARIFQNESGEPRGDVIAYIQRAVGYGMTADVSEQCLFMLHGRGNNGKTTFMDTVKGVMGEYAMNGLPTLLLRLQANVNRNSDDEADLQGRRMVSVSETDEGQRMDEAKAKRLVGNGRIRAMRKFESPFEFEPTHKLFLDCNHKPRVKGDDDGIWRRIKLIPFLAQVASHERDEHLGDKLKAESSGILNWMLHGLRSWRAVGLNEPSEISKANGEYRSESDTFGLFLSDCIQPNDATRTAIGQVYATYCRWADDNGSVYKLTKIEFGNWMNGRGYETRKSNGVAYYVGCALMDEQRGASQGGMAHATISADATADATDDRAF